jgi:hypothetical protein
MPNEPEYPPPRRILSDTEQARRANVSLRTWQRNRARGEGPPVIAISLKRRGSFENEFEAWLESRKLGA